MKRWGAVALLVLAGCQAFFLARKPDAPPATPDLTPVVVDYTDNDGFDTVFEAGMLARSAIVARSLKTGTTMETTGRAWRSRLRAMFSSPLPAMFSGALRSGAGLVKLATPSICQSTVAGFEPSAMTIALPCDADGRIDAQALPALQEIAKEYPARDYRAIEDILYRDLPNVYFYFQNIFMPALFMYNATPAPRTP